ncbi:hypothetical protein Dda_7930 [Drechslerella dactyloides]|uniref:Mg2+ transporter protein, CorA-like/Zinc transport protein ZntB n=1 Tax=Drechslerella dactyloides TaxID=74499 RepID=A0AAD6IRG4_DREDA|nr:hypothetical protein Dda_7930 [Drechslerella dactyloides]
MAPRPPRPAFPQSVQDLGAHLDDIDVNGAHKHDSYYTYLESAKKEFSDLGWTRFSCLISDYYQTKTGEQYARGAFYSLDIGTFTAEDPSLYTVAASPALTTAADVAELLRNPAAGTKMRLVIYQHSKTFDHTLLMELASFYDVSPRALRDHFWQHWTDMTTSNLNIAARDWYSGYLPSEAGFSPIQLERTFMTRSKKTSLLIPREQKPGYRTVIVFIWDAKDRYSKNVINRDLIVPSLRMSDYCIENLWQPSDDIETCLFRLSRLSSSELAACISQPIFVALPFLRTYLLETSQDIKQIQDHLIYKGLTEFLVDRDTESRGSALNWGPTKQMPFETFHKLNESFAGSIDTIKDHLLFPWIDRSLPGSESTDTLKSSILADVRRIQDQMADLRAKINEYSAYTASQESINEARKSVAQASSVTQLTRLAFIYIPLTFATSLFGINISEWQDAGMPSGKWFLLTAALCTVLTIAVAMGLSEWQNHIETHGGVRRSMWRAVKRALVFAIFWLLATFPRMIADGFRSIRRRMRPPSPAGKTTGSV